MKRTVSVEIRNRWAQRRGRDAGRDESINVVPQMLSSHGCTVQAVLVDQLLSQDVLSYY